MGVLDQSASDSRGGGTDDGGPPDVPLQLPQPRCLVMLRGPEQFIQHAIGDRGRDDAGLGQRLVKRGGSSLALPDLGRPARAIVSSQALDRYVLTWAGTGVMRSSR